MRRRHVPHPFCGSFPYVAAFRNLGEDFSVTYETECHPYALQRVLDPLSGLLILVVAIDVKVYADDRDVPLSGDLKEDRINALVKDQKRINCTVLGEIEVRRALLVNQ